MAAWTLAMLGAIFVPCFFAFFLLSGLRTTRCKIAACAETIASLASGAAFGGNFICGAVRTTRSAAAA
jgi:hypothetical protein